jgi:excisionase family DNA binding protein
MALRYLSTTEAGKAIGVSANTIRAYTKLETGALPSVNVAIKGRKRIRIREDALREFVEQRADSGNGAA